MLAPLSGPRTVYSTVRPDAVCLLLRMQFHASVRNLLSKGEEESEETPISRSAPRFTEATRHLLRSLRVLSLN